MKKSVIILTVVVLLIFLFFILQSSVQSNHITSSMINDENKSKITEDSCKQADDPVMCIHHKAATMIDEQDLPFALMFVKNLRSSFGYGVPHMVMHHLGYDSLEITDNDFEKALAMIPEDINDEKYYSYDGYIHGLTQAYFLKAHKTLNLSELFNTVCGSKIIMNSPVASSDCYHTIGHGLMHMNGNDISNSLAQCGMLIDSDKQQKCSYGVFMEQSALYNPLYHPDWLRSYKEETLFPFCMNTDSQYKYNCAHFTGHSYLFAHPGDYKGAFELCNNFLEDDLRKSCVQRIALVHIPNSIGNTEEDAQEICSLTNDLKEYCIQESKKGFEFSFKF